MKRTRFRGHKHFREAVARYQAGFDAGYEKGAKDGYEKCTSEARARQDLEAREARIKLVSAVGQAIQSLAAVVGDAVS